MVMQQKRLTGTKRVKTLQRRSSPPSGKSPPQPARELSPADFGPAALDVLPEPVWLTDAECRIRQCNRVAQGVFGNEIIGRRCWEVVHGAKQRVPGFPFSVTCLSCRRESAEFLVGMRRFNCMIDPLFSGNGKFSGVLHVMREITPDDSNRARGGESRTTARASRAR